MFTPPVEVSAALAAFAPLFTSAQLAPRASPAVRRAAGPEQPHPQGGFARAGLGPPTRFPERPSLTEPRPLVRTRRRPGAAQAVGGGLRALGPRDRRLG